MTEIRKLDLPEIAYIGTDPVSARRVYDLHDPKFRPVGWAPFADELKIVGGGVSIQSPRIIPANVYGQITVFVDPAGRYLAEAGDFLHGKEDCTSRSNKPVCWKAIEPGRVPFMTFAPPPYAPVVYYRKGDRLVVAPEGDAVDLHAFGSLLIEGEGDWPFDPGVAYAVPCNSTTGVLADGLACVRCVLPTRGAVAGTHGQLHVSGGTGGVNVAHVSIGLWSGSGPSMVATPVPVLWSGGSAALSAAPGADVWSDVFALGIPAGAYLVLDVSIPAGGVCPFKLVGQVASWFNFTAPSYSTPAMTSPTQHGPTNPYPAPVTGRVFLVDCLRVLP